MQALLNLEHLLLQVLRAVKNSLLRAQRGALEATLIECVVLY
jgi:hypothetical protein